MEEIDTNTSMKKNVCKKRASEDDATCEDPMVPITPHSKSENVISGLAESPSPFQSPTKVFDPFAPAPDTLNVAPYFRKYESKLPVARELRFDLDTKFAQCSQHVTALDEEVVFQSLYSSILEVIMSTQTKEIGVQTPPGPRHSGAAHTCPPAPLKTSKRRKIVNSKICRKLEF